MGQTTSEVSICNQALGWLGLDPIISLDDPVNTAALCKANFAPLRDALMESTDWTFAQKRIELPKSAAIPAWGYAGQFELPADCLRINYVTDSPDIYESMPMDPWVREGSYILTQSSSCFMRYTAVSTDPKQWSEGFAQALAARLAAEIAMAATDSATHMGIMQEKYTMLVAIAKQDDGRQGTAQIIRSNDLKRVRR